MNKNYAHLPVANSDKIIIIDACFYPVLRRYTWCIPKGVYAGPPRPYTNAIENGKSRQRTLARVVTKTPEGMYPKHLNGNGLDCRRANIELVDNKTKAGSYA